MKLHSSTFLARASIRFYVPRLGSSVLSTHAFLSFIKEVTFTFLSLFIVFACNAKSFAIATHVALFLLLFSLLLSVFGRTAKSFVANFSSFVTLEVCIDLILTNLPKSFQHTQTIEIGLSDFHKLTLTVLKTH